MKDDAATRFGKRLVELREKSTLTQVELAKRSGISVRTLQHYEARRREPKWSHVCALAAGLKVKLDAFNV